jgi:D-alanyl-D-alanine endopeptidase (penicillin-binding protein 7)
VRRLTVIVSIVSSVSCVAWVLAAEARPKSDITYFAPRTPDGLPNVQSPSAIALDLATGEVLYAKNADEVRPIASTGKLFVAMAARRWNLPLTETVTINRVDRDFARGGAPTRLSVDYSFTNHDLLRAMLIASDNRAPSALGRGLGLDAEAWIAAINAYVDELGLSHTEFTDLPGLRGNVSTARELATAFRLAWGDPVLRAILSTEETHIYSTAPRHIAIKYFNTNRLMRGKHEVLGGKTGYTDAAGFCLVTGARIGGREVVMAFLGSWGKLTRYGDFGRVADWMADGRPNSALAVGEESGRAGSAGTQ